MHLHLTGSKAVTRMPLMLLAARLRARRPLPLFLTATATSIHVVRPPSILIASGRRLHSVVCCCNVLNLARSHTLSGRVDLMGHASVVKCMLILGVLRWPVLAKATVALPIVLDRHVHSILHFQFCLLLLQLALIPHVVAASGT